MKLFIIVASFFMGTLAFANDSTSPKITVKGIDPGVNYSGTSFKVYGGNLDAFIQALPYSYSVGENGIENNSNYRYFAIESRAWKLDITCDKTQFAEAGVECTFDLMPQSRVEDYGDTYEWDGPTCSEPVESEISPSITE